MDVGASVSRIVVLGCGAVGLPLAVAFARQGFQVVGVDRDPERLALLREGQINRTDEGLADALRDALVKETVHFTASIPGSRGRSAFVLAVPTSIDGSPGAITTHVEVALAMVLGAARDGDLVIVRSTVSIGTTRRIAARLREERLAVDTACCPDRSLSGRSFLDQFAHPNVVGGLDPASTSRAAALFAPLGPVLEVSTPEAAEAVKLFANVQRDTAFALANQMALICEELGLDFFEIATAGSEGYPRFAAVRPGPVGGPCLSKDAFLMAASVAAPERLATLPLAARAINQSLLDHVAGVLADFAAARGHRDLVIAVLGLAFKGEPITMDRRGSFGVALSARLRADFPGAIVRAFDPASSAAGEAQNLAEALQDADVAILANDHPALTQLDLAEAAATLRPGGLMYDVCGAMRAGARRLPNGVVYRAFGNASADEPNVVSAGLSRKA